jgi:hypothetical protein
MILGSDPTEDLKDQQDLFSCAPPCLTIVVKNKDTETILIAWQVLIDKTNISREPNT